MVGGFENDSILLRVGKSSAQGRFVLCDSTMGEWSFAPTVDMVGRFENDSILRRGGKSSAHGRFVLGDSQWSVDVLICQLGPLSLDSRRELVHEERLSRKPSSCTLKRSATNCGESRPGWMHVSAKTLRPHPQGLASPAANPGPCGTDLVGQPQDAPQPRKPRPCGTSLWVSLRTYTGGGLCRHLSAKLFPRRSELLGFVLRNEGIDSRFRGSDLGSGSDLGERE